MQYYQLDALGSVRAVTTEGGVTLGRHDYLPFGGEWAPVAGRETRLFTGQERDAETGLDYFGARHYRANVGRFTTVDPKLNVKAARADPQRWNRYAYARGNPMAYVDPDGRDSYKVFLPLGNLGGNWKAAEEAAQKAGHTFEVFRGRSATVEAYNKALGDPAKRVFWVGHTVTDFQTGAKGPIMLHDGLSAGTYAQVKGQASVSVSVHANTVGLFGCNSIALGGQYTSGTFVGVASGPNQQTDVHTLDQGAALFVASDASGQPLAASAQTANRAWVTPVFGINIDDPTNSMVQVVLPPKK